MCCRWERYKRGPCPGSRDDQPSAYHGRQLLPDPSVSCTVSRHRIRAESTFRLPGDPRDRTGSQRGHPPRPRRPRRRSGQARRAALAPDGRARRRRHLHHSWRCQPGRPLPPRYRRISSSGQNACASRTWGLPTLWLRTGAQIPLLLTVAALLAAVCLSVCPTPRRPPAISSALHGASGSIRGLRALRSAFVRRAHPAAA